MYQDFAIVKLTNTSTKRRLLRASLMPLLPCCQAQAVVVKCLDRSLKALDARCEFLRASCDDVDVEACVGKAVGGVAGEDGLVVVIALCGFAESEGVGAVGGGGGGAVGAPVV